MILDILWWPESAGGGYLFIDLSFCCVFISKKILSALIERQLLRFEMKKIFFYVPSYVDRISMYYNTAQRKPTNTFYKFALTYSVWMKSEPY